MHPRDLPPERWAQVEDIVDRALDLPPELRADFVRDECGDDAELRNAAERWLDACHEPTLFPDEPAAIFAAQLIDDEQRRRIGPYRLIRELGRGGMGTVFLAERDDGQFDRRVALKLMRRGTGTDTRLQRRFLEERQILARLEHPHIATLLDGGITGDGQPFFVMQYVEGVPIDRFCDERGLSIEARLAVFLDVCDAVQHAHQHAVVHRDLKPSNILVTDDGRAKLLDFGIAKLIEVSNDEPGITRTGERLLTPDYASPEQIRGEAVTPASDVYALGVLLHRLLTGRWPYRRELRTPHDVERAVLEDDPTLPSTAVTRPTTTRGERAADAVRNRGARADASAHHISRNRGTTPDKLRRRLRGDLDAIVITALRKQPDRRYATAGDLAGDIRRHLAGLPIRARGRAHGYRIAALVRRHRVSAVAAGIGMIAGAGVLAFAIGRDAGDAAVAAETPVLAIGRIVDHRDGHAGEAAVPLADMLATNLARTRGLGVVSAARMIELLHQFAGEDATVATRSGRDREPAGIDAPRIAGHADDNYARAASLAGATQLIDGSIYSTADGGVRLDLRRVDVASGAISGAHSASGADLFDVADRATLSLVTDLGLAAPPGSIADVTTGSLAAYAHYADGLERYYARDLPAAEAAFDAALREDSTFAMAAFYAARATAYNWRAPTATAEQRERFEQRTRLALRLAGGTSDRERLMIRAWYALHHLAPDMRAIAETLAIRYPHEIVGHIALAQSMGFEGDIIASIPHFQRVFAMDSATIGTTLLACAACDAISGITEGYAVGDSLVAAERSARRWIDMQPSLPDAHLRLADILDAMGRFDETDAALRDAPPFATTIDSMIAFAKHWIRAGRLATADTTLRRWADRAGGPDRAALLYYRALTLRNQGRLTDALAVARDMRNAAGENAVDGAAPPSALVQAQTLLDLHRFAEAEALFDSIARWTAPGLPPSVQATFRVLAVTMLAATQYAAGDTTRLAALADSLQRDGERAHMFRPRDQHLYVRGLLLLARGLDDQAIDSFRRALAVTSDFGRLNLELSRLLLRHGRADDAIAVLTPASRGWFLDTTNLHMILTEVHETLAQAWEAAGNPDSAAVHWSRVARDWQHADAAFQPRRLHAAARVTR